MKGHEDRRKGVLFGLWQVLRWRDENSLRDEFAGYAWVSEDMFGLHENRFCDVMDMKANTLNFKLRFCPF
jgi:hypothetical protein